MYNLSACAIVGDANSEMRNQNPLARDVEQRSKRTRLVPPSEHTTMCFARRSRWAVGSTHPVSLKKNLSRGLEIQSLLRRRSSCKTADVSKHAVVCANTSSAHEQPHWQMPIWFRLGDALLHASTLGRGNPNSFGCQWAPEP